MKKNARSKSKDGSSRPEEQESRIPQRTSGRKQLLVSLGILAFLAVGTTLAVLYGRGYRFVFREGEPKVSKTGILHVTSSPEGAQVYIDGHSTTATDSSVNLAPKKYTIRVSKDGYNDWQKDVDIEAEVVTNVNALLFPKAPTLQSISTFGIEEALIDPTGTKIAFKIANQSVKRNGIYIFDMTQRPLPILQGQSSSTQLADDTLAKFSEAKLSFSPDGKELLASISAALATPNSPTEAPEIVPPDAEAPAPDANAGLSTYYLLKTDGFNDNPQDITATSINVLELWQQQRHEKENARLKTLKPKVLDFTKKHFRILSWSPTEKKILYQATESATMPVFLSPRRIGNNLRYERRDLERGAIYVYNITEDINTRIVEPMEEICPHAETACEPESTIANPFSWFPDSGHLIYLKDKRIHIVEDDGANMTTIYAGPFLGNYVFPWPDGSRIVILTNLGNPSVSPTLYTIGLK
jgi:hypothetical protein